MHATLIIIIGMRGPQIVKVLARQEFGCRWTTYRSLGEPFRQNHPLIGSQGACLGQCRCLPSSQRKIQIVRQDDHIFCFTFRIALANVKAFRFFWKAVGKLLLRLWRVDVGSRYD
jgi:hypothetical protein